MDGPNPLRTSWYVVCPFGIRGSFIQAGADRFAWILVHPRGPQEVRRLEKSSTALKLRLEGREPEDIPRFVCQSGYVVFLRDTPALVPFKAAQRAQDRPMRGSPIQIG